MQLTEEQAKEFYKEQEGTPHFEDLIREMTAYVAFSHYLILSILREVYTLLLSNFVLDVTF